MEGCQLDCSNEQALNRTTRSFINIPQNLFALEPFIYSSMTSRRIDITFTYLCQHQLLFECTKTAAILICNIFVRKT